MESSSASIRDDLPWYRTSTNSFASRRFGLLFGSIAAFASFAASATSASELPRFRLVGVGTLTLDKPTLKSGNVHLKADLTPSDAAISSAPPAQEGGGYALMANLAAASLVCYNDTIFRDDFDGDGF
jgi:hypothetical protein